MAKAENGQWSAWTLNGGLRYSVKQPNGKKQMVKNSDVPADVKAWFENQPEIAAELKPSALAPRPEEQDRFAPDETPVLEDPILVPDETLEPADFAPTAQELEAARAALQPREITPETAPAPIVDPRLTQPVTTYESFPTPVAQPATDLTDGLIGLSIFDAPLQDIARALYERFGIYSVWLNQVPETDDISPISGNPMTNYDRGAAYQAFMRAESQGTLNQDYEQLKNSVQHSRQLDTQARGMAQAAPAVYNPQTGAQQNSFDYRTSPEATLYNGNGMQSRANPEDPTDPLAEPPVNRRDPIIRPNW